MGIIVLIVLAAVLIYIVKKGNEGDRNSIETEVHPPNTKEQEVPKQPAIDTMLVNLVNVTINKIGKVRNDGITIHIRDGYQRIVFENAKYDTFFQCLLSEKDDGPLGYKYILEKHYSMTENEAWLLRYQNGSLEIADWVIRTTKPVNQDTMMKIVDVVNNHSEQVKVTKYSCQPWEVNVRCDVLKP